MSSVVASPIPPVRGREQRLAALQLANAIRVRRARLKREIREGAASVAGVLLDPPDWAAGMRVFDLLQAAPKFGPTKTQQVLRVVRVSSTKTVGGLSVRQRHELAGMLSAKGGA